MLLREQKQSARAQQPKNIRAQLREIGGIVKGEGAVHKVKGFVRYIRRIHVHAAILDFGQGVLRFRDIEHPFRKIDPHHAPRTALDKIAAVVPETAADVQNVFPRKVGQQRAHGGLLQKIVVIRLVLT